jgi:cation diffusion facilitator CzcD-associated flavoprotein CzcO
MPSQKNVRIAVIGAGPVGLIAGRELLHQGFTNFWIFEKAPAVGGTWQQHSYPGLNCDVKAHAYTFTGERNPDFSANYVGPEEIQPYLERSASKFGLDSHLHLDTEIAKAAYQGNGKWKLTTVRGDEHVFDFVINAMGNQHTPVFPDIPGRDRFQGESWHSTLWNHDVDLAGKRIAVIGSAASAVQIVPEIAPLAGHLFVLQRSPNWILPRGKKAYSSAMKTALRYLPGFGRLHRFFLDLPLKLSHGASVIGHKTMTVVEDMGRKHIADTIPDEEMRETLMPTMHFGCKRPLVSDDFYPALVRDDVTLVAEAAREVNETGVVTQSGRAIEADVIIYCTGYKILDFERIDVTGEDGQSLAEFMGRAPEAYKGIAVPGFPNYFLGVGPNGVLLSASFFVAAEANVRAIVKLLREKEAAGAQTISPKKELHREYNDWIASERGQFSWGAESCSSYYRTPTGHTPFLFPGNLTTFLRHREEVGLHEYDVA